MARLSVSRSAPISVEITPVMPALEGPHNAYDVVIREGADVRLQRQYRTYAWSPDGHWHVWRLFRAFQLAERMAASQTTLNVTGRRVKQFNEPATLSVDVGWLHVVLRSDTLMHTHGLPEASTEERCQVCFYLQETDDDKEGKTFRQFVLHCRPHEAVQFGSDLVTECREALRLRRALGITAPADDYIDT